MEPSTTLDQAQQIVETKTAPRVTKESIEAAIKDSRYHADGILTICIIEMHNGFKVIGKAAPASPANYDPEVGKRYAYEDAFRQLWQLEGYALCQRLHEAAVAEDRGRRANPEPDGA